MYKFFLQRYILITFISKIFSLINKSTCLGYIISLKNNQFLWGWIMGVLWRAICLSVELNERVSSDGIIAKVLDYSPKVSEFKLQLGFYILFQTNTLEKGMDPLISPDMS